MSFKKKISKKTFKWGHSESMFVPEERPLICVPNEGAMRPHLSLDLTQCLRIL